MDLMTIRVARADLLLARAKSAGGKSPVRKTEWILDDTWPTQPFFRALVEFEGESMPNEVTVVFNDLESPFVTNVNGLAMLVSTQDLMDANSLFAEEVQALGMTSFQECRALLAKLEEEARSQSLSAHVYQTKKDALVERAVRAVGRACDVELKWDHRRYGDGAVAISALNKDPHAVGCGRWGSRLAAALGAAPWRTGAAQYGLRTGDLYDQNGWAYFTGLENVIGKFAKDNGLPDIDKAASGAKIGFEVTAAGFDASSDDTDDRVIRPSMH